MNPIYFSNDKLHLINNQIELFHKDLNIKSLLFLTAEGVGLNVTELESLVKKVKIPVLGGVFPELIADGKRTAEGLIILPLPFQLNVQLFDLENESASILEKLEEQQKQSLSPNSTVFTFVDSLSNKKDAFTESLFNYFGINATYFGGGTGSLTFKSIPSIITNNGIFTNAAVIGWTNNKIALGAAHGWQAISDPIKITKAEDNKVVELDWIPAFEVYRKIVEEHGGTKFTSDNFFSVAKSYPLGIAKMDAEMVVRDPFKVESNIMHFFDSIQEGEYIKILHGDMSSLLEGAKNAKQMALKQKVHFENLLCIDCISRAMFMDDQFNQELEIVEDSIPLYGILSIGEIANTGESFLEIYNKTIAVGIW